MTDETASPLSGNGCDAFGRTIRYLRVSVTDRCNLRCVYCMPEGGIALRPHGEILTYEEIERVVRAAVSLGITKVRLTGGEPLVRPGIADLVRMLANVPGVEDLSMTTNGVLLAKVAPALAVAGLQRVNVSLDSLRPERFARLTRWGKLEDVLSGIAAARAAGLNPVKVNVVVVRGQNDDEVLDFARLTLTGEWHVRFIELMPFNGESCSAPASDLVPPGSVPAPDDGFVPTSETWARLAALGPLEPAHTVRGNGPARYYRYPGAPGTIGFISAISEHFCDLCNRLRLTADGQLRPCLFSDKEMDIRDELRDGADTAALAAILERAVAAKPSGLHLAEGELPRNRRMSQIGG